MNEPSLRWESILIIYDDLLKHGGPSAEKTTRLLLSGVQSLRSFAVDFLLLADQELSKLPKELRFAPLAPGRLSVYGTWASSPVILELPFKESSFETFAHSNQYDRPDVSAPPSQGQLLDLPSDLQNDFAHGSSLRQPPFPKGPKELITSLRRGTPEAISSTLVACGIPSYLPLVLVLQGEDTAPSRMIPLLEEQRLLREQHLVPRIAHDPSWCLIVDDGDRHKRRVNETILSLADGTMGTRGSLEEDGPGSEPAVFVMGVYEADDTGSPHLLSCPNWTNNVTWSPRPMQLDNLASSISMVHHEDTQSSRPNGQDRSLSAVPDKTKRQSKRTLDMYVGTLERTVHDEATQLQAFRFSCLAAPGTAAMRVETNGTLSMGPALSPPSLPIPAREGEYETSPENRYGLEQLGSDRTLLSIESNKSGGVSVAATQRMYENEDRTILERLVSYVSDARRPPPVSLAEKRLEQVNASGFDLLLAEHRREWVKRWEDAGVWIKGDPRMELAIRFALFQLMSQVPTRAEAVVGARGLSGRGYSGHVFWDSDVFVLPVLASVQPSSARAMLSYRINRLHKAEENARIHGYQGARFPWESADDGSEVTPTHAIGPDGKEVAIRTGEMEEHITADVAWALWHYLRWTNDISILEDGGASLVFQTARYWASRVEMDSDGTAHINHVIGPDEYHEDVDDNAFTNLMARWNLSYALELLDEPTLSGTNSHGLQVSTSASSTERLKWHRIALSLVDGFDQESGVYEQFKGFFALEPLLITEIATPPVAGDLLLGHDRIAKTQVIKQADVLMAHHMIGNHMRPGSLLPNLDYYGPRTSHGSSLSPAIHASLLARAGRIEQAYELFKIAAMLDLDDLTDTTASGLHMATLGGVWQALAFGFLGMDCIGEALHLDPQLPNHWEEVELHLLFQGAHVRVRTSKERLAVSADREIHLVVAGSDMKKGKEHECSKKEWGWRRT